MAKKATDTLKIKKKRWISLIAPDLFRSQIIGESHVLEPDTLIGRTLNVNLMTLTNDIKKQNVYVFFKVTEMRNGNAQTILTGYQTTQSSLKRLVRRNKNKLDDSFVCQTGDNVLIRVKPVMLTRSKATGAATRELVRLNKQILANYIKKISFENFAADVISNKLQRNMKDVLSKVYPLKGYEVREFIIETGKLNPNSVVKPGEDAKVEPRDKQVKEEGSEQQETEEAPAEAESQ